MDERTIKKFNLEPKAVKFKELLNKDFLKITVRCISNIDPNVNRSHFTLEGMQKAVESGNFYNKPILGNFKKEENDFGGHDSKLEYDPTLDELYYSYDDPDCERPLGCIRESDPVRIVYDEKQGVYWIEYDAVIWTKYCYNGVKKLLLSKSKKKKVSVEIEVLKSVFREDGVEEIQEFNYLGTTLLSDKLNTGIQNAELTLLDTIESALFQEKQKALVFAYNALDQFEAPNKDSNIEETSLENEKEEEITMDEQCRKEESQMENEDKAFEEQQNQEENFVEENNQGQEVTQEETVEQEFTQEESQEEEFVESQDAEVVEFEDQQDDADDESEPESNEDEDNREEESCEEPSSDESEVEEMCEDENCEFAEQEASNVETEVETESVENFEEEQEVEQESTPETFEEEEAEVQQEEVVEQVFTIDVEGEQLTSQELVQRYIAVKSELFELKEQQKAAFAKKLSEFATNFINADEEVDDTNRAAFIEDVCGRCAAYEFTSEQEVEHYAKGLLAMYYYENRANKKKENAEFSVSIQKPVHTPVAENKLKSAIAKLKNIE